MRKLFVSTLFFLISAILFVLLDLKVCAVSALVLSAVFLTFVFLKIEKRKKLSDSEGSGKTLALFENTVGVLSEGLIIIDGNGNIIFSNSAAKTLLNIKEPSKTNLITNSHSPAIRGLINRAKDGKHSETGLIIDGSEYELSADPFFEKGAVCSIAILILRESEKEKSAFIRREFTANVSHELKTPLHVISGYAELLKNNMVREEDKERFLSNIWSESQRLIDLIDDTIKLSRLDEGGGNTERENVDLFSLAQKTISLLETKAERYGITLSLSGKSCYINGIVQLLEGIIFNLVDNAIKYNRENGSVSVEIKENEESISLTVCDTGIGIPEEYRERVFERFYRVDKSHSKEVGGTGLGLSIVKHAAKLHQAHIELYSVDGGGTSVRVLFPKQ